MRLYEIRISFQYSCGKYKLIYYNQINISFEKQKKNKKTILDDFIFQPHMKCWRPHSPTRIIIPSRGHMQKIQLSWNYLIFVINSKDKPNRLAYHIDFINSMDKASHRAYSMHFDLVKCLHKIIPNDNPIVVYSKNIEIQLPHS